MRRLAVALVVALASGSVFSQSAAKPADSAEYKVLTVKSPVNGQPVNLLVCNNGSANCAYKWDELCESGKPENTDPMGGVGGDVPSYLRDRSGTPMRMFVCKVQAQVSPSSAAGS